MLNILLVTDIILVGNGHFIFWHYHAIEISVCTKNFILRSVLVNHILKGKIHQNERILLLIYLQHFAFEIQNIYDGKNFVRYQPNRNK